MKEEQPKTDMKNINIKRWAYQEDKKTLDNIGLFSILPYE